MRRLVAEHALEPWYFRLVTESPRFASFPQNLTQGVRMLLSTGDLDRFRTLTLALRENWSRCRHLNVFVQIASDVRFLDHFMTHTTDTVSVSEFFMYALTNDAVDAMTYLYARFSTYFCRTTEFVRWTVRYGGMDSTQLLWMLSRGFKFSLELLNAAFDAGKFEELAVLHEYVMDRPSSVYCTQYDDVPFCEWAYAHRYPVKPVAEQFYSPAKRAWLLAHGSRSK